MTERPYLLLQRGLHDLSPNRAWPDGLHLDTFSDAMAREAHILLETAYASGGGRVPDFERWWSALSSDTEYAPDLCFPVRDRDGALAGFAQCWTSGFVKDLAVHPDRQRHGLGSTLLLHIFHVFRARGAQTVALKVEADNFPGIRFYRNLGMSG